MTRWVDRFVKRGTRFWVLPSLAIVAALILAPIVRWIDARTAWEMMSFTPEGASSVLTALSSTMLTFIVFVITALLVVVQLASAQLTPRIINFAFESAHIRRAITTFAFAFAYTVSVSGRVTATHVPQLGAAVALFSCLVSIALFFYFANRLAIDMRPVSILTKVGNDGCEIIASVYPSKLDPGIVEYEGRKKQRRKAAKLVLHAGSSGSVLSFVPHRIVAIAVDADVVVEMVPQVGDFVARGDPLFRVTSGRKEVSDDALRACVSLGPERTQQQDPRFCFRIILDIANKALSPAINDPTTGVLAIDQIHRLLLSIGRRRLDEGDVRDSAGQLRLVCGTPDWDDYVSLGISEIRHFGAGSIQICRRLFALLTHLMQVLPKRRGAPLRRELKLLHASVMRTFPDPEDQTLAHVADTQGMGGAEPVGRPSALETDEIEEAES